MSEYLKRENVLALAAPTPGCFSNMISSWDVVHMPAEDVVEVVRCRDCRHWGDPYCMLCKTRVGASYRSKDMAHRKPDDFCSYGERRGA